MERGGSNWELKLRAQGLPTRREAWHRRTIRWFLEFGRKQRPPLSPNRRSGNYYYTRMVAERNPPEWQKQQWREAIGFYLDIVEPKHPQDTGERVANTEGTSTDWESAFVRTVRGRHLSYRTEVTYRDWLRRFDQFRGGKPLREVPDAQVRQFLSDLAVRRKVSAGTQHQAFNALLFLYREVFGRKDLDWSDTIRARTKKRIPVVLTVEEVRRVLAQMEGTIQLMGRLLYGSGLRLMELIRLRVNQLDFARRVVVVRGGKGDKDRETVMPSMVIEDLKAHLERVRRQHEEDLAAGFGRVWMPPALARKYPAAARQWIWQWVFPSRQVSRDPRSGITRRHHVTRLVGHCSCLKGESRNSHLPDPRTPE